jgi:hypothetical protein
MTIGLDRTADGTRLGAEPSPAEARTAFSDPHCPVGTPKRQSIEARAYTFIDDRRRVP